MLLGLRTTIRSSFRKKKSYVIPNYETLRTFIQFLFFSLFVEHTIDSLIRTTFCHNLWLLYGLIPDWYLHTFFPNSKNVDYLFHFNAKTLLYWENKIEDSSKLDGIKLFSHFIRSFEFICIEVYFSQWNEL